MRFRSDAEKLPGVEKVAIMDPDDKMLESQRMMLADLGPVGAFLN